MSTFADPADARRRELGHGEGVPWSTVVPLAVVVAYADGFWLVALRGAAGAVGRTDAPFAAWLRESTLLLPVYAFAVLAALALALRWFGAHPGARTTAATSLLVVAATTLAGIAVMAASSAYDYELETAQLASNSAVHGTCAGACLAERQGSILALQVHAVGLGSLLIVASNLVLVGLVVAFRGGRIDVTASPRRPAGRRALDDLRLFVVAGLLGAAAIHNLVVPGYLVGWTGARTFVGLLCAAEVAVAFLVAARPRSSVVLAAAVLSSGTLLLWPLSRTVGLPLGTAAGATGPVGLADGAAVLLAAATLVAAVALLRADDGTRRPGPSPHLRRLALVAVVAVTAIGLGGALAMFDEPGGTGGTHVPVLPSEHGVAGHGAVGLHPVTR